MLQPLLLPVLHTCCHKAPNALAAHADFCHVQVLQLLSVLCNHTICACRV
jgi:hypothetical protein